MIRTEILDLLFPFFVLAYGLLVSLVLHVPPFCDLVHSRLPEHVAAQLVAHRILGWVGLTVGLLWSLQVLWLGDFLPV